MKIAARGGGRVARIAVAVVVLIALVLVARWGEAETGRSFWFGMAVLGLPLAPFVALILFSPDWRLVLTERTLTVREGFAVTEIARAEIALAVLVRRRPDRVHEVLLLGPGQEALALPSARRWREDRLTELVAALDVPEDRLDGRRAGRELRRRYPVLSRTLLRPRLPRRS